jgi:muramoyltetrapeptide carboxypeptidase
MDSTIHYPAALQPGDLIVVTAPSSGVPPRLHARLELVLAHLRAQGFRVEEGQCLRDEVGSASAAADARASELMHTLQREDVAAIIPPWGGELAIELLDRLDFAALRSAKPKWILGYSDTSTWMLPLTLRLGWATAHGPCLMDLVVGQNDPLTKNVMSALATPAGGSIEQRPSSHWQSKWTDFADQPDVCYTLSEPTQWRCLNRPAGTALQCSGRLIGGCIDTLVHVAGTPFGDVQSFIQAHADSGVLLYLENAEMSPTALVRAAHRLRWSGWLEGLTGLFIGRSAAPDTTQAEQLRYADALMHSFADLPCPVIVDMDIGHRPPQLLLVNGAWAELRWREAAGGVLLQRLV